MLQSALEYMTCLLNYTIRAVWTGSVEFHGVSHFQKRIHIFVNVLQQEEFKQNISYHTVPVPHHTRV